MADRHGAANRRRKTTLKRSNLVSSGANNAQSGSRKPNPENRSENSDSNRQKQLTTQLENTYRMIPASEERFEVTKMENLMSEILVTRLKDMTYNSESCSELSKELTCAIIARTKEFKWQRYKLVAQVHLGQKDNQGVRVASRCIWNSNTDTFACVSYNNSSLFAVASCYGIYFE